MRKIIIALAVIVGIPVTFGVLKAIRDHHNPHGTRHVATAHATARQAPVHFPEEWIPDAAVAVLEIGQTDEILNLLLDPALSGRLNLAPQLSGPAKWRQAIGTWMFRQHFERKFGADWQTLVRRLVKGGVTVAAGSEKTFVAIVKGDDADFVQKLHDELVAVAGRGARQNPGKVSQTPYEGVPVWTLNGGNTYHAVVDGHVVLSNKLPAIRAVLDLRAGKGAGSLAKRAEFLSAKKSMGRDAAAALYVSPAVMNNLPLPHGPQRLQDNPMAVLLLAAYADAFQGDAWTALELDCPDGNVSLRLSGTGKPVRTGPKAFAWPAADSDGALPNLVVPRQVANASLYRDLRHFYANKDALFPERTSQLIFFENMMGIFFSGRDIAEDVMGAVDPHVRLVVAEQAYDPAIGTPSIQIPAIALVFRMRDPKRFGIIAEEAWQKMLGLVNFSRGQKAQPGMIIDRLDHSGVRYSCAAFSHAEEKDKSNLDTRFNFRPAIVHHDDYLIFSTTDGLANDLIDALGKPSPKAIAGINSIVEINGSRLASLVEANSESMIRDNMVKKGQTREQAEKGVAAIPAIARALGAATLRMGAPDGKMIAELNLTLHPPNGATAATTSQAGVAANE
ncbi:MAG TPA: hypothetical protein PLU30_24055 [Verrucomicrobiae bacterium]|nr:hypothetical protein [Verrucomicrobiae bacterium]